MNEKQYRIPRIISRFLDHILPYSDHQYLKGDYEEIYDRTCRVRSKIKADLWITKQLIRSTFLYYTDSTLWGAIMFKNYLKTALRSISRNKTTSFINISGLSIGIAFSLLAFLFVDHEYSYDKFHEDTNLIYRVWTDGYNPVFGEMKMNATPTKLFDDFKNLYPEISSITRMARLRGNIKKDGLFFSESMDYVDPEFFKIFSYPVLQGNRNDPVSDLNSIVLSAEMAEKYFGDENPIGKQLEITVRGSREEYFVTSVIDNCNNMSTLTFDFLLSFEKYILLSNPRYLQSYGVFLWSMYIKLSPEADIEVLSDKVHRIDEHIDQQIRQGSTRQYQLQNIKEFHLDTEIGSMGMNTSDPLYSYIFAGIGGVVLIIACINFMILSLGLSVKRIREVGLRKVVGAFRSSLIKQFLGEAVLMSFIALGAGIMIAILFLPVFNDLSGKSLEFALNIKLLLMMGLLALSVGFISGSYPALFQSKFDPVRILKGASGGGGKSLFSKCLVIIQFSLSIILIIATVVFQRQLSFMQEKNLGFDHEKVLEVSLNSNAENATQILERFRNEIISDQRIKSIAGSSSSYGAGWMQLGFEQQNEGRAFINFSVIDCDYLKTMGIEIVMGRDFSKEFGTDPENALIINEKAVEKYNLEDPIGKKMNWIGPGSQKIVGVIKDFHYGSLHNEIEPLLLCLSNIPVDNDNLKSAIGAEAGFPLFHRFAVIKISEGDPRPVIDHLKSVWQEISPNSPFEFQFIDETIQSFYESEQKWGKIVNYASIFAVIVACLGLFGLSLISSQKRIKEIGIRKVLGASSGRIVKLISAELIFLVAFSSILAWPVAYFIVDKWLQNFAYKIDLTVTIF
ncbi:MAG: FtsX-like permease family protein, partial [bacterium]|nr:FtsX-like permease family protein [bacterium]